MSTKINIKNEEQVKSLLDQVQKRAKARTQNFEYIKQVTEKAERMLDDLNLKNEFKKGAVIDIRPNGVVRSYGYKAEGTYVKITRGARDWFVTDCDRYTCNSETRKNYLILPDSIAYMFKNGNQINIDKFYTVDYLLESIDDLKRYVKNLQNRIDAKDQDEKTENNIYMPQKELINVENLDKSDQLQSNEITYDDQERISAHN